MNRSRGHVAPWVALMLVCAVPCVLADEAIGLLPSPWNGRVLDLEAPAETYTMLLVGHAYGAHGGPVTPAASLLANIDRLNQSGATFLVLLGDTMEDVNDASIRAFRESFANEITCPIFNAVGNHDMTDRELYHSTFGSTFFSFRYGSGLFVFLDGESDHGDLVGAQLAFVFEQLDEAEASSDITEVFLFSHRLLWAIGNPPVSQILPYVNGPSHHPETATTFTDAVLPRLKALTDTQVFLVSGDVGTTWSLSLFYEKDPDSNVTYVATGVGDTERDAVVLVTVDTKGPERVRLTPVSLTGRTLGPITQYGLDYWRQHFETQ